MTFEPDFPEGDQVKKANLDVSHKFLEIAAETCQVESKAEIFVMSKQEPQQEEMGCVCLFFQAYLWY